MAKYGTKLSEWLIHGRDELEDEIPERDATLKDLISEKELLLPGGYTLEEGNPDAKVLWDCKDKISNNGLLQVLFFTRNGKAIGTVRLSSINKMLEQAPEDGGVKCKDECYLARTMKVSEITSNNCFVTMDKKVGDVRQIFKTEQVPVVGVVDKNNRLKRLLPADLLARKLVKKHLEYIQGKDPVIKAIEEWVKNHLAPNERFLPVNGHLYSPNEILDEVKKESKESKRLRKLMAWLLE